MLTERERSRLAPVIARIRTTTAQLAAAEQALPAAKQRLTEAGQGVPWRDRLPGGLFSREPARARVYRNARRARNRAATAVSRQTDQLARLRRQADAQIAPMLARSDPGYMLCAAALRECDRALGMCRRMRQRVDGATASARAASADPSRNEKAARDLERARHRYAQLVAEVQSTAAGVGRALAVARRAVRDAGAEAEHLAWDPGLFDQLPGAVPVFDARRRAPAKDPLQRLQHKLSQAVDVVQRWRAAATAAQERAVAAARDRLVNEPDQLG